MAARLATIPGPLKQQGLLVSKSRRDPAGDQRFKGMVLDTLNLTAESRRRDWSELFQHQCQYGNQNEVGD